MGGQYCLLSLLSPWGIFAPAPDQSRGWCSQDVLHHEALNECLPRHEITCHVQTEISRITSEMVMPSTTQRCGSSSCHRERRGIRRGMRKTSHEIMGVMEHSCCEEKRKWWIKVAEERYREKNRLVRSGVYAMVAHEVCTSGTYMRPPP